jgi:hypothetical protein
MTTLSVRILYETESMPFQMNNTETWSIIPNLSGITQRPTLQEESPGIIILPKYTALHTLGRHNPPTRCFFHLLAD